MAGRSSSPSPSPWPGARRAAGAGGEIEIEIGTGIAIATGAAGTGVAATVVAGVVSAADGIESAEVAIVRSPAGVEAGNANVIANRPPSPNL